MTIAAYLLLTCTILIITNYQWGIIFSTLYETSFNDVPDPNCYQPIHCIRSLSELFSRLISNQTQDTIVQQEEDSPEELVPPPTEFRTSESTAYPEWSDTDPYTIPTDNDEVFFT